MLRGTAIPIGETSLYIFGGFLAPVDTAPMVNTGMRRGPQRGGVDQGAEHRVWHPGAEADEPARHYVD